MAKKKVVGVDDFIMLNEVNEDAVIKNLQERFESDEIYTFIGDVVVSLNPFKDIPIYTEERIQLYKGKQSYELPPHVFSIADDAYQSLARGKKNQCIIISGESGAGKTEAAKRILQFIASVSGKTQDVEKVKNQLIGTNPVLEAFGNAKTLRNDNSSRFGKYMQIEFDFKGDPVGGKITNYLLEKSRVVKPLEGERNFHIFYLLLNGASPQELASLKLTSKPEDYKILSVSNCTTVKSIDDKGWYKEVKHGMKMIGFSEDDDKTIFKIVAAVLHLGNIEFIQKGDVTEVQNPDVLNKAAEMLEVDPKMFTLALTSRTITAGTAKAISKTLTAQEAKEGCSALTKALYERLFKWIVNRINENIQYKGDDVPEESLNHIGVLDIYGFEILQYNSFEQFCINYCNEKLQQLFIELTLKKEQEEYEKEGVQWTPVQFFNNKTICDLIENKPQGIIAFLDEEISLATGTEQTFLEKITKTFDGHAHFQSGVSGKKGASKIPQNSFLLKHYAGEVLYSSDGILDKNKDQLFKLHQESLCSSKSKSIRIMFPPIDSRSTKRPPSAGTQFKRQVNELMDTLMASDPHYIRTIKSNDKKMGGLFQEDLVRNQVKYLGLLENIRVRRAGYCYRKDFGTFLQRYKMLTSETWPKFKGSQVDACTTIVKSIGCGPGDFQCGKTKIFIKRPETVFALEEKREDKLDWVATKVQSTYRGFAIRHNMKRFRAALIIQKVARRFMRVLLLKKMTPEQKAQFVCLKASARIFENRKQGWKDEREWKSNYVGAQLTAPMKDKLYKKFGDTTTVFACVASRINSQNKAAERGLIITEKSIYYTDPKNFGMKHRIDIKTLDSVILSSKPDLYFVLKDNDSKNYDWIFESKYRTEFVVVLHRVYQGLHGKPLKVVISNKFDMRVKPNKTRSITFEVGSGKFVPTSKTAITIYAPQSNEPINQQTVFLGTKTNNPPVVHKKREKKYKALFDYDPLEVDEMELKINDLIIVGHDDKSEAGWCIGFNQRSKKKGLFPLNYTEPAD